MLGASHHRSGGFMKKIGIVACVALGVVGAILIVQARAAAKADDLKQHHAKERAEKIAELYDDLIAPTPTLILTGQRSVAHIFDVTAMGRVTPAGEFHDHEAVNEYFFGLATTPTSHVVSTTMQSLAVSGDKVAVEVDIRFVRSDASTFTLRQTGFFTFNDRDLVTSFDLTILNLGAAVNPHSMAEQEQNIQGVCAVLTGLVPGQGATCAGTYPGATAVEQFGACVTFMHTIPYGTWDRANSNTVVCRQLHTLLTPFRPAVHCPHAGPTGGNACIDFTYDSFFDHEF
jgi:hypothetical protein